MRTLVLTLVLIVAYIALSVIWGSVYVVSKAIRDRPPSCEKMYPAPCDRSR